MAATSPVILLVEDELPIRRFLRTSLASDDYRILEAETGEKALRLAAHHPPDLVILDLGLPDMDGQDLLRQLREWLRAPIIILSARDQEQQKVLALDNGADDYLTKPFGTPELLARIRVALRHSAKLNAEAESSLFTTGHLTVDLASRRVLVNNEEVHLTPLEYKLLTTLVAHAGKVLTHRFLLNEVWGSLHARETHYLRVFMASLRRKLEDDPAEPCILLTEPGVGYRLVES
jgi:two-component system, OmpR family, KDP operon response regulator KdpE